MTAQRRSRFTITQVDKLALSDGDWIEVKRFLSAGEERLMQTAGMSQVNQPSKKDREAAVSAGEDPEQSITINWERMAFGKCDAFILDWSFVGPDDKPVPYSPAKLRTLDQATFKEIEAALDEHIKKHEGVAGKKPASVKTATT